MDIIDGHVVEPRVVSGVEELHGVHQGSVKVAPGAELTVSGTIQGSVTVESGATIDIRGSVQGSLALRGSARGTVHGAQEGSVNVDRGAVLVVAPTGKLAGSLRVEGRVENQGIRGGTVSGTGEVDDTGGHVKEPTVRNGMQVYEW